MKIEIEANEKEIAALFDMIRGQRKNDNIVHCYDNYTKNLFGTTVQSLNGTINCTMKSSI